MKQHFGASCVFGVAFVALLPAKVAAQGLSEGVLINIYVADSASAAPIEGAQVELPALKLVGATDKFGLVSFSGLKAGYTTITAAKRTYVPTRANIVVGLSNPVEVTIGMRKGTPAQDLDTVAVRAKVPTTDFPELYKLRRAMGLGSFLSGPLFDSVKHEALADFLARRLAGVRAEWAPDRSSVSLARAGFYSFLKKSRCEARVYIDDVAVTGGELALLQSGDIEAVEYYSNAPPVQYARLGAKCGVLLVWTKR